MWGQAREFQGCRELQVLAGLEEQRRSSEHNQFNMESIEPRARHRGSGARLPPTELEQLWFVTPALWAGRLFVLSAVAFVIVAHLGRASWASEPWTRDGFPTSWVPNVAVALALVVAILSPWLSGLATSPHAVWREADDLVARTVIGRRRVSMRGAHVFQLRIPSQSDTVRGALIIDRRFRPLILLSPFASGGPSLEDLVGRAATGGYLRICAEYLMGGIFLMSTAGTAFTFIGVVGALVGAFR